MIGRHNFYCPILFHPGVYNWLRKHIDDDSWGVDWEEKRMYFKNKEDIALFILTWM